jgi:predicted CoA-binding protein
MTAENTWTAPTNDEVKRLLEGAKTVAIVGISNKEDRASYQVAKWLLENSHFTLYFVNPVIDTVLGQKTYPSLAEIPDHIDIVDVFRRSDETPPVLDKAIAIGASAIWLQLGIANDEVAERGSAAGLQVVMDRCIKVDYAALLR